MAPFEPEDEEDALFHTHFGSLRQAVVGVARGLSDRIKGRVADVERSPPRVSDVVVGGFAEALNLISRILGVRTEDDDDG